MAFAITRRFDLTTEKLFTLSDQTRNIVSGLKEDLTVARFDKESDAQFDNLMAEYKALSPHFKYEIRGPSAETRSRAGFWRHAHG